MRLIKNQYDKFQLIKQIIFFFWHFFELLHIEFFASLYQNPCILKNSLSPQTFRQVVAFCLLYLKQLSHKQFFVALSLLAIQVNGQGYHQNTRHIHLDQKLSIVFSTAWMAIFQSHYCYSKAFSVQLCCLKQQLVECFHICLQNSIFFHTKCFYLNNYLSIARSFCFLTCQASSSQTNIYISICFNFQHHIWAHFQIKAFVQPYKMALFHFLVELFPHLCSFSDLKFRSQRLRAILEGIYVALEDGFRYSNLGEFCYLKKLTQHYWNRNKAEEICLGGRSGLLAHQCYQKALLFFQNLFIFFLEILFMPLYIVVYIDLSIFIFLSISQVIFIGGIFLAATFIQFFFDIINNCLAAKRPPRMLLSELSIPCQKLAFCICHTFLCEINKLSNGLDTHQLVHSINSINKTSSLDCSQAYAYLTLQHQTTFCRTGRRPSCGIPPNVLPDSSYHTFPRTAHISQYSFYNSRSEWQFQIRESPSDSFSIVTTVPT